jgi:hypothetical protein
MNLFPPDNFEMLAYWGQWQRDCRAWLRRLIVGPCKKRVA